MLARLICITFLLSAQAAYGQVLQLITVNEAKLAAVASKPSSRAITRGPGVKLASPDKVSGVFPFKIEFAPRGESKIEIATVKVEYLRGAGIDLTGRLKASTSASGISVASASAPPGEHSLRVSVRDSEGREGRAEFTLTVK